jgi:hypothetical protein
MAQHNYQVKLLHLYRSGKLAGLTPGKLAHVDIYHDDWCNVFSGGVCNCNPDIKVRGDSGQQAAQETQED